MNKQCTMCKESKPLSDFWRERNKKNGYSARCKKCKTTVNRKYRKSVGYDKKAYWKNPAAVRERHLKRKYGVTLADYSTMLERQNGRCAICQSPESEQFNGVFHVDHCHKTGDVRGLLCRGCNHMLGVVGDDPKVLANAIRYLVPQVAAEFISAFMESVE